MNGTVLILLLYKQIKYDTLLVAVYLRHWIKWEYLTNQSWATFIAVSNIVKGRDTVKTTQNPNQETMDAIDA